MQVRAPAAPGLHAQAPTLPSSLPRKRPRLGLPLFVHAKKPSSMHQPHPHAHYSNPPLPWMHTPACTSNPPFCRELLGVPGQARQLGLTLLVQFCGMLLQPAGSSTPHAAATAGLRGDAHFWRLLRQCLADAELANRKCAAHVLQQAVAGPDGKLWPLSQ